MVRRPRGAPVSLVMMNTTVHARTAIWRPVGLTRSLCQSVEIIGGFNRGRRHIRRFSQAVH